MAIPGYRWVRGLVPADVYKHASREKGASTWDDHLATVLGGTKPVVIAAAPSQTRPVPSAPPSTLVADVEVSPPPVRHEPVEVVARTAIDASSFEPGSQVDPWATADEVLRLGGITGSIVIGASATLCGTSTLMAESE